MADILFDITIQATREKVFESFCLPEHLDNWWTLKSSGSPELGNIYNLNFTDQYNWFGEVSDVVPNERFYLKMTQSDPDWDPTTFGIELEEKAQSTLLKFSHANWPTNNHHFRHSAFCWAQLLNGLKNYIEKGVVIPFENRS